MRARAKERECLDRRREASDSSWRKPWFNRTLSSSCRRSGVPHCTHCARAEPNSSKGEPIRRDAAREFGRVLRPGGRVGLSDLTRGPTLPKELAGLLAWIACVADAQPVDGYAEYLRSATFEVERVELHDEALAEMVQQIRMKLLGAEIMVALNKLSLPGVSFSNAKQLAKSALDAIQKGQLGHAIITASKPRLAA
jgi:arsenite methyltransferase